MLGNRLALMHDGRIIETAPAREIFLSPKTEFAALFFASGQVLPCKVPEKRPGGIEVSSPIGTLTVPAQIDAPHSDINPEKLKLFIPHDALSLRPTEEAGWVSFNAKCLSSVFEGSKISLKLKLAPNKNWQFFDETSPRFMDVISGPRTPLPSPGTTVKVWLDQSLLRFVK